MKQTRALMMVFALILAAGMLPGLRQAATTPAGQAPASAPQPVNLVQTIELTGIQGVLDHLALDTRRNRIWITGLGCNKVLIVDVAQAKLTKTIDNLNHPTGIVYMADRDEFVIAESGASMCHRYMASTGDEINRMPMPTKPDNLRYDPHSKRLYVGCQKSLQCLKVDDPASMTGTPLDGAAEAFELDPDGVHIYVNVPQAGHIAVIDRTRSEVVATWKTGEMQGNFPMALDAENHRLLIGCRAPQRLAVIDTATGKLAAEATLYGDCDDLSYDPVAKRIYASCGHGTLDVFRQVTADHYELEARIPTGPRARTSLLASQFNRLYVALPRYKKQEAALLGFETVSPAGAATQPAASTQPGTAPR